jgi:hypothetical protein
MFMKVAIHAALNSRRNGGKDGEAGAGGEGLEGSGDVEGVSIAGDGVASIGAGEGAAVVGRASETQAAVHIEKMRAIRMERGLVRHKAFAAIPFARSMGKTIPHFR